MLCTLISVCRKAHLRLTDIHLNAPYSKRFSFENSALRTMIVAERIFHRASVARKKDSLSRCSAPVAESFVEDATTFRALLEDDQRILIGHVRQRQVEPIPRA